MKSSLQALKFGDRFFFTHATGHPSPFTPAQLDNIRKRHLGDILCDHTGNPGIKNIKKNVFVFGDDDNMSCDEKTELNLSLFV